MESGERITLVNNYYSYSNNDSLLFANSVNSAIEDTYKRSQTGCQYWLASPYLATYDEDLIHWGFHSVQEGMINTDQANDMEIFKRAMSSS